LNRLSITFMLLGLSLLALSACGGASESDVAPGGGGSGVPPLAVVVGPLVSNAPLTMNGVSFAPNSSLLLNISDKDDDGRGPLPGMIAEAQGVIGADGVSGTVFNLAMSAEVRGLVSRLDLPGGGFEVMGVTVIGSNTTVFEDQRLDTTGLKVGDAVQVHGYPDGVNRILATRIIRRVTTSVFKTTGILKPATCLCPPDRQLFSLGSLAVWIPSSLLMGLPNPLPANSLVRIKSAQAPENNTITASEIRLYARDQFTTGAFTRMRGVISELAGETFRVNGIAASAKPNVIFEGGTRGELANGRLIELQGSYTGNEIFLTSIKFLP
jgi:Domain of unknown function (DUF5666)